MTMNKIIKLVSFFSLLGVLVSCKKDENRILFEGGKAPVLTASIAENSNIPLSFATKDNEAIRFNWTNPDYRFTTGVSSQDVKYALEIDTTGANFTNPKKQTVSISKDLSKTIIQNDLNDYLLNQMVLVPGIPHNIEMRVVSTIGNGAVPLASNVMKFRVTPYAIPPKVIPPGTPVGNPATNWINGRLYIVGNATPGGDASGWNNPVPVPSQEFTKVSATFYTLTIALNGGKSYLLLPVNGDWGVKYGALGANNSNNPNSDDFRQGGGDLLSPAASGNYKIEVDFQRGKITVTKL